MCFLVIEQLAGTNKARGCNYNKSNPEKDERDTGAPPSEIAATRRVQAAKRLIDQTTMGLSDIAFAAGFRSVRRFNDAFRATYGRPHRRFAGASSDLGHRIELNLFMTTRLHQVKGR